MTPQLIARERATPATVGTPDFGIYNPEDAGTAAVTTSGAAVTSTFIRFFTNEQTYGCYDLRTGGIEVAAFREDTDAFVRGTLVRMLAHEHLHHVLHEVADADASRALDNIDRPNDAPLVPGGVA